MAKRFLFTQWKKGAQNFINYFAMLGIAFGTAALIITLTILGGFEKELKEKVISFTSHIQISGFQNKPLLHPDSTIKKIQENISNVQHIYPYVSKEILLRSKENIDGVFLKGIDEHAQNTLIGKYIIENIRTSSETSDYIILGEKLAQKLNVRTGEKVTAFDVPNMRVGAQPRAKQFVVEKIFATGMAEYDDVFAFTSLKSAQQLFLMQENVSGYDIVLNDITMIEQRKKEIQQLLSYPHYARTVFELYHNLFSWIELQKKPIPIIIALIVIVAAVNIISALLIMVLERTHTIGILKSFGATSNSITKIFLFHGMFIGCCGVLIGNILALSLCLIEKRFHYFTLPSDVYFMKHIPFLIQWENFALISVCVFVLTFLVSFIPSRAISRISVIDTLRFA
ncbi:MAG: ABC transporter permease [Bacteroidota bacterium]